MELNDGHRSGSVIIGISLLKKVSFIRVTTSVIIGSIIYKACVAIAIKLGMPSSDLKMITAVLFLVILVLGMESQKDIKNINTKYKLKIIHY